MKSSIDEILRAIYRRYSKQSWTAAVSAVVIGVITHLFVLTNEFFNHDDLGSFLNLRITSIMDAMKQYTQR